jgi:putative redox protein
MAELQVHHEGGDRFTARIRGHEVVFDQPAEQGGDDAGPTPTEVFAASLAACVGFFARRFLSRHDLPTAGLRVDAAYELSSSRPSRVERIIVHVVTPAPLPERRRAAFERVCAGCTVHNSLHAAPDVKISVSSAQQPAAAQGA